MLIVISDSDFKPGEANVINELFRSGLDLFHIRKYGANEKELSELVEKINPEYREKLVLNHHHELGISLGLKRFHYSEKDRVKWQELHWKGMNPEFSVSTSLHTMEEYNRLPDHFSYAFLSPVFDSISKEDYKAVPFDFSVRKESTVKLIALGGIHSGNAFNALQMGFDGVALLGAIWKSSNPVDSFAKIQQVLKLESNEIR